jgi:uncharacterized protein (DUF488 family)
LPPRLATIGYEHDHQAEVIRKLKDAGVEVVIDVRAVPSSRRAGFSKNIFAASLKEAGIDYRHLKALGTPKPGREAARAGRVSEMEAIFEAHMQEPEAQFQLQEAGEIAFGKWDIPSSRVLPRCSATKPIPPAATAASSRTS